MSTPTQAKSPRVWKAVATRWRADCKSYLFRNPIKRFLIHSFLRSSFVGSKAFYHSCHLNHPSQLMGHYRILRNNLLFKNMPVELSSLKQACFYSDIINQCTLILYSDCNYRLTGEQDRLTEVRRLCPNSKPTIYSKDLVAYGTDIDKWSRAFALIFKSWRSCSRWSSPYQIATVLITKQICVRLALQQITVNEHHITALCTFLVELGVTILEQKNENRVSKWVDDGLVTSLFLAIQRFPDGKTKSRTL